MKNVPTPVFPQKVAVARLMLAVLQKDGRINLGEFAKIHSVSDTRTTSVFEDLVLRNRLELEARSTSTGMEYSLKNKLQAADINTIKPISAAVARLIFSSVNDEHLKDYNPNLLPPRSYLDENLSPDFLSALYSSNNPLSIFIDSNFIAPHLAQNYLNPMLDDHLMHSSLLRLVTNSINFWNAITGAAQLTVVGGSREARTDATCGDLAEDFLDKMPLGGISSGGKYNPDLNYNIAVIGLNGLDLNKQNVFLFADNHLEASFKAKVGSRAELKILVIDEKDIVCESKKDYPFVHSAPISLKFDPHTLLVTNKLSPEKKLALTHHNIQFLEAPILQREEAVSHVAAIAAASANTAEVQL